MGRRLKNPGAGTVVGLGLLALGGWVVYDTVIKPGDKNKKTGKKSDKFYGVFADCRMAGNRHDMSEAEIKKKAAQVVTAALKKLGGEGRYSVKEDLIITDVSKVLGTTPGILSNNLDFAQAWATEIFKQGVNPKCLKEMNIPKNFGAQTNAYGADYTEWGGPWPGDTQPYLIGLVTLTTVLIMSQGYDVGLEASAVVEAPDAALVAGMM